MTLSRNVNLHVDFSEFDPDDDTAATAAAALSEKPRSLSHYSRRQTKRCRGARTHRDPKHSVTMCIGVSQCVYPCGIVYSPAGKKKKNGRDYMCVRACACVRARLCVGVRVFVT